MGMSREERDFHRKTAVAAFNHTWDFLEKRDRNAEDEIQMIQLAHVSRYHWGLVGTPRNNAVGDWQISRVYASVGHQILALRYARLALTTCRKNSIQEVLPSAYEGMARAYAIGKDPQRAGQYLAKARRLLDRLPLSHEDKVIYQRQIDDTQRLISTLALSPTLHENPDS